MPMRFFLQINVLDKMSNQGVLNSAYENVRAHSERRNDAVSFSDGHKAEDDEIVFFLGELSTEHFEECAVLTLDDLGKTPDYLARLPYEEWASIPFQ